MNRIIALFLFSAIYNLGVLFANHNFGRSYHSMDSDNLFDTLDINPEKISIKMSKGYLIEIDFGDHFFKNYSVSVRGNSPIIEYSFLFQNRDGASKKVLLYPSLVEENTELSLDYGAELEVIPNGLMNKISLNLHNMNNLIIYDNILKPIEMAEEETLYYIFPNPSSGDFTIQSRKMESYNGHIDYSIYDLFGKLLEKGRFENNKKFDFGDNISTGIYFIELKNDHLSETLNLNIVK